CWNVKTVAQASETAAGARFGHQRRIQPVRVCAPELKEWLVLIPLLPAWPHNRSRNPAGAFGRGACFRMVSISEVFINVLSWQVLRKQFAQKSASFRVPPMPGATGI